MSRPKIKINIKIDDLAKKLEVCFVIFEIDVCSLVFKVEQLRLIVRKKQFHLMDFHRL